MGAIGRESEKWRYDFTDASRARAHALGCGPFEPEPSAALALSSKPSSPMDHPDHKLVSLPPISKRAPLFSREAPPAFHALGGGSSTGSGHRVGPEGSRHLGLSVGFRRS